YAEDAWFIKARERGQDGRAVPDIVREMASLADGMTMSAKKDPMANIGGWLALRDDGWAEQCRNLLILTEGFVTYGGLAGRDLEAIAQGLRECVDEHYLRYRTRSIEYLADALVAAGVPIVRPAGGHAVYLDARALLAHVPPLRYPGQALAVALYEAGGIRGCAIATFTSDLIHAIRQADPSTRARIAAIDERSSVRAYGSEVRWRIRQGSPMPYRAAARAINRSNADIVCVQHEFGLYGLWKGGGWVGDHWIEGTYEDHLTPFLDELEKPALVTLHTVLPEPSPAVREAVRSIADSAHGLTVMAETAVDILRDVYGIAERPIVIPHGMPHIEPIGRRRLKAKLG